MDLTFCKKEYVQQLYDSVLLRSVLEFRKTFRLLKESKSFRKSLARGGSSNEVIEEMQRSLRVMESEVERRGLNVPGDTELTRSCRDDND